MPPEPPWDRKEVRKHDGGGGGAVGGFGGPRWREPLFPHQHHHPYNNGHHHHGGYNNNHHGGGGVGPPRWLPDFRYRPPPGHGKQGSRHYLDEFGPGFLPSRSNEKMLDDENFRASGSARYGRNSRENRGSYGQKDWRGHSSEIPSQLNGPVKPSNASDLRSVDIMPSQNSSHPSSDSINLRDQCQPKVQHESNGVVGAGGSTIRKLERENSLNSIVFKPVKWTRSGSMSSRGSGFSHSISSKITAPDSDEMKVGSMVKDVTPLQSPSGDATAVAACATSVAPPEETNSRKKQRLGWGEGLAKYEKKKVEGADDSARNGATACGSNSEPGHSYASNLTDKSPRLAGFPECASPATPSSFACSSSPGHEEKQLVKAGVITHDSANICNSPSILPHTQFAGSTFNLEDLDMTSISSLNSSIKELLLSDDHSSVDSSFERSTAINKLLLLKNDISKVLEATESEIDMLENELKSLTSESRTSHHCLAASSSEPVECSTKPREDHSASSNGNLRPAAVQLVVDPANSPKDDPGVLKDVDVDSPGSATSKFSEVPSSGKDVSPPDMLKHVEVLGGSEVGKSNLEMECSMDGLVEEMSIDLSSDGIGFPLIASCLASDDNNLQSGKDKLSHKLVLASNIDCAARGSEVFDKLLSSSECHIDYSRVFVSSCVEDDLVKERFLRKKYCLQLKEKLLTIKFKMFHHLWKEDMHLLSLKKLRAKSHKKFDLSVRSVNGCYQKHRASIRSRYSSTGLSLLPTTELMNYASRLLADPQVKPQRCVLKMPSMILDRQERISCRFISYNGLVEDPSAVEKERSMINPWSPEEKEIFIDKLSICGKDFRKIASFLDHKTTADCVEFYYKNHKSDAFERAKKKPESAKQGKSSSVSTAWLTSGKRRNCEANAVPSDMLGAASAIAVNVDNAVEFQRNCTSKPLLMSCSYKSARGDDGLIERSNSLDLYDNERETAAADVLAGICGSLSSEAMSSCITSSVDPGEGYQERKYQRVGSSTRRPLTPEVTQNVDDETCSDESCGEMDSIDWTDEEKSLLIQAVSSYGRDFTLISRCVRTRSREQCKVFFSKARKCLGLDRICPGSGTLRTKDVNGGGSNMEDVRVLGTGSVPCSEKSGLKMEEVAIADLKLRHDPAKVEIADLKLDLNRVEEENEVGVMDFKDTELKSSNFVPGDHWMENTAGLNSDIGKPSTSGDVKLFGQILSKPSQQNLSARQGEGIITQHHNGGSKSSSSKCSSSRTVGGHSAPTSECNGLTGTENLLSRDLDFLNRQRMQSGFSSLSDSAVLLAKYPAAFGNYAPSSSNVEQLPLHALGKNNECSLNGASVFPSRDNCSSNGLADFQVLRNQELQPFTIDARQRRDILLTEMQRRNGFDVVSGMLQQSRAMVGINVVGRGGLLVGGQCVGVSDPVAAIRMHYAKSEPFSGQAGSIIGEDDSWSGKGSVGR